MFNMLKGKIPIALNTSDKFTQSKHKIQLSLIHVIFIYKKGNLY